MAKFAEIVGGVVKNIILSDTAPAGDGYWVEVTTFTGTPLIDLGNNAAAGTFDTPPTYTEADHLHDLRKTMVCSRLQGRLVLGPDTCAALDAMAEDPNTLWAMRETIKNAGDWRRLSPSMDELGYLMGYSHEAMDALFKPAMSMQV